MFEVHSEKLESSGSSIKTLTILIILSVIGIVALDTYQSAGFAGNLLYCQYTLTEDLCRSLGLNAQVL